LSDRLILFSFYGLAAGTVFIGGKTMTQEIFSRYELKYIITDELCRQLRQQLSDYMEADKYSRDDNFYTICNIYYDTDANDIIRKSIEKPVYKEKLRLRSYGVVGFNDNVYLEIKKKYNGRVYKRRTELTLAEAYDYMKKGRLPEAKSQLDKQIINEIDNFVHKYKPLLPAVFISYDRLALYSISDKSFRVTFDTNVRSRRYEVGLEKGIYGDLLMPAGYWLMEVKVNEAVPLWFVKILSKYKIYPVSFSKYGTEYKKYIFSCDNKKMDPECGILYA